MIPSSADKIGKLKELAKASDWTAYLRDLDIDTGLAKIFDAQNTSEIFDFQASSMTSSLKTMLMQELKIEQKPFDGSPDDKDAVKKYEEEKKALTSKLGMSLTKQVHD